MKSLAISIPVIDDATSFYRGAYPLAQLRERCKNLNGLSISNVSEAILRVSDGAFFQRPHVPEHKIAMEMALETGRKIWIDYDDFLLDIPSDNPTFNRYMSKSVQDSVRWALKNADIITVSTAFLGKLYEPFVEDKNKIRVIPNAVDMGIRCMKTRKEPGARNKIIAWRGSQTHHRDVFTHARAILQASLDKKTEDWNWHFIGDRLWFITDSMPHLRTFLTNGVGPIEYHKHIAALLPSAFMVPLHDSPFNRSKSNIAWMEAVFAGAAAICPAWDEWKNPGAILYETEQQFMDSLYAVTSGQVDVVAMAKQSWDYIQENLTLAKVNDKRVDVLCELFECDRSDLGAN